MIYNLYFEYNQTAKIAHLSSNEKNIEPLQYLIVNTAGSSEIFSIDKELTLISSTAIEDDKRVCVSDINIQNEYIEVFLKPKEIITKDKIKSLQKGSLRVYEVGSNPKFLKIMKSAGTPNLYEKIYVHFIYANFKSEVVVHCVPANDLYDVVLDFGSEASQMLIRHNSEGGGILPQPLFGNILRHYWRSYVGVNRRVYDQQEDNKELFRSIFFKKENATMSDDFEVMAPSNNDNFLNFITKRTNRSGERIPNVKISFLTGIGVDGVSRDRMHVGIIMRFLHEAVTRIAEMQTEAKRNNKEIAIRFTILLPNVMPQSDSSRLILELQKLANSSEFFVQHEDVSIPYIQVNSCSESDASFLERMNNIGLKKGNKVLTIDIGKGTTDFSISKYISSSKATCIFRSGFVGAGNAISYAIFERCIEILVSEEQEKNKVIEKVLSAEPALLFELDNIIENIKHNWDELSKTDKTQDVQKISISTSVEVIIERIQKLEYIPDSSGIVKKMTETIADNIIKQLPVSEKDIRKIIISGRAYKFSGLRDTLKQKLKLKFKGASCLYDENSAKSGCLYGVSSNKIISLSTSMIGIPIVADTADFSQYDCKNDDKWYSKLARMLKEDSNSSSTDMVKEKEIMSKGYLYKEINANSLILISGRSYIPEDGYIIDNSETYYLYFDGTEFYLRHSTGSHKLVADTMPGIQLLARESQFPYSF